MNKKLRALQKIATMISDAELASLKEKSALRQAATAEITSLQEQQAACIRSEIPDSQFTRQAVDNWMAWSFDQHRRLSAMEAFAAAQAETQKRIAAKAFGRASVLKKLSDLK